MLSIIVPAYNEESNVNIFVERITQVLEKINANNYELIFCLDPSEDRTKDKIVEEIKKNKKIKLITFSRRFGQSNCIYAGIKNCTGEYCAVIDIDLQDPPELLIEMYEKIKKGYDCIYATRTVRKGEGKFRILLTNIYYYLLNKFGICDIPKNTGEFRIFSKKIIEQIKESNEFNFFLRGMTPIIGYKHSYINFDRPERDKGKSKYKIGSFIGAISGIINFSKLISVSIIFYIFLNILFLIYNIFFNFDIKFIYIILSIIFFNLIMYGIVQIISNTNFLIMKRKSYIIDEKINFE